MLVQSRGEGQVTLLLNEVDITLGSTVHIMAVQNQAMTIANLEGTVVVAASGATRIVHEGAAVRVPLAGSSASAAPSQPVPYDIDAIREGPLDLLDLPIELPQPIGGPTVPPVGSTLMTSTLPPVSITVPATRTPTQCNPSSEWTQRYTVQRGDNLSTIARRFGLTTRELQDGNCIANPDLIRAGQVLAVPDELLTSIPSTFAPDVTTQTTVQFRSDAATLTAGQCTTIRWESDIAAAITFEGQSVENPGSREVCPTETTSYRLVATYEDGRDVPYTLRIEVGAQPAATEDIR
jgi:LysM repeat protein